jgi:hypothetical protein
MRKYRLYQCLVGTALFLGLALPAWAETVELVTYYPTSANITDDLRLRSLTVGTAYKTTPTTLQNGVALISNRLGIGTTNPEHALHVATAGTQASVLIDTLNNTPDIGSTLSLRRSQMGKIGAGLVPLAVNAGDVLGGIHFMGSDGAGYEVAAAIRGLAEGTWTSGSNGSRPAMLQFFTRPEAAGSLPAERMRITSDGALELVGLNTPPAVSANDRGRIYYNSTTDTFMVSESGGPYRRFGGLRIAVFHGQGPGTDPVFPRIEHPTGEQIKRFSNPDPIDTGIPISNYPHAVAIFRGSTQFDSGRQIWVEARNDLGPNWHIDIEGDLRGSGEEIAGVFYSLLAWSDPD